MKESASSSGRNSYTCLLIAVVFVPLTGVAEAPAASLQNAFGPVVVALRPKASTENRIVLIKDIADVTGGSPRGASKSTAD